MKQIQLREGITLMAVEPNVKEDADEYDLTEMGGAVYVEFTWMEDCDGVSNPDGYSIEIGEGKLSDFTLLGTAPELLAREDAEEVCRKWCDSETDQLKFGGTITTYKNYDIGGLECDAVVSFQSALDAMGYNGEILIIKDERK